MCGPLIAGIIRDKTGSFGPAFYVMGSIMTLGTLVVLPIPFFQELKLRKEEKESQLEEGLEEEKEDGKIVFKTSFDKQ